jgi:hypothetical protein
MSRGLRAVIDTVGARPASKPLSNPLRVVPALRIPAERNAERNVVRDQYANRAV